MQSYVFGLTSANPYYNSADCSSSFITAIKIYCQKFSLQLLYVIKYITGNEKGKYEKARKLFHGPLWLGKGDFKDQADYADAGFRRALNDIYPDVCVIKGHVETVREPSENQTAFTSRTILISHRLL